VDGAWTVVLMATLLVEEIIATASTLLNSRCTCNCSRYNGFVANTAPKTLNDEELRAWRALLRAHAALVDVLEQELAADRRLPLSFYEVLVNLSEAGGRLRMSDLAGRVLLSRSGLTRLIDRMIDAGLVARETCPRDRRGLYATMTPTGRAELKRSWPVHVRGVVEHFAGHLEPGEATTIADGLDRIATALGRPDSGAPCATD